MLSVIVASLAFAEAFALTFNNDPPAFVPINVGCPTEWSLEFLHMDQSYPTMCYHYQLKATFGECEKALLAEGVDLSMSLFMEVPPCLSKWGMDQLVKAFKAGERHFEIVEGHLGQMGLAIQFEPVSFMDIPEGSDRFDICIPAELFDLFDASLQHLEMVAMQMETPNFAPQLQMAKEKMGGSVSQLLRVTLPQNLCPDTRCYEAHTYDIDACLLGCEQLDETEWRVSLASARYMSEQRVTAFTYVARTNQQPGICTHESLSKRMTAFYLLFDGCCEKDVELSTAGVHSEFEWDFLRGGWVLQADIPPTVTREFTLYVNGDVPVTPGSVCVRGNNVRCACDMILVPDLCNANTKSGIDNGMLDTQSSSSSSSSSRCSSSSSDSSSDCD